MKDVEKTREQLQIELDQLRQQRAQEKAAERIRVEVLSMRSSKDLMKVVGMMWEEMVNLGMDIVGNTIRFVEEEEDGVHIRNHYYSILNPRKFGLSWTSPHLVEFIVEIAVGQTTLSTRGDEAIIDSWRRKKTLTTVVSGEVFA